MTVGIEVSAPAPRAGFATGSEFRDARLILESRGWSAPSIECAPKLAALASLVNLAPPDPVASVSYHSRGNVLVIAGDARERARRAAEALAATLPVTLLDALPGAGAKFTPWTGALESLTGYLGEFSATVAGLNGAAKPVPAKFDLVLDFSSQPRFAMRQPPQGYYTAPADEGSLEKVIDEIRQSVGEFEKPRYFAYRESICAHSRSQVTGCNACIEICSTQAIVPDGDHVKVDPHLCMGCGACSTVCPSGAMSYQFPRVADRGAQMKQLLSAYRHAGGEDACIVFHNGYDGRELLAAWASSGAGLPARALPLETWHVSAIGLDLLLPAIAFGASQVVVISAGSEDLEYREALRSQMAIAETILAGLGYGGTHFALFEANDADRLEQAFARLSPAQVPASPATFLLGNDKRTAIEFAVEHLAKLAPAKADVIALPEGSPFGEVLVDKARCTMCLACVGACPVSALMDGVDKPLLKFLERNCVQCGLCESTCPEDAIRLAPRLLLTPQAREARVLNEAQPFHCVSCAKPFGTKQMVEAMLGRLAGHSMFTGEGALRRLQMCADCRVVDMMSNKNEASVLRLGADS
ncbi:MAG TPA: 4Fe-4S binding protein [Usitatibacter sp.]